jgi:hypothetical protein
MSEKDRKKKDHERQDKQNKAMREAVDLRRQESSPKTQDRDRDKSAGVEPPGRE